MDASRVAPRRSGWLVAALLCACGDQGGEVDASLDLAALPYAQEVVTFTPGQFAGYGQDRMPEIVLGPPEGAGVEAGSTDVLSLGVAGEIVLAFGDREIVDRSGVDFIVFENAFWAGGDPSAPWAELAEVAVSEDGIAFAPFPCDIQGTGGGQFPGCAGWRPTLDYDPLLPLSAELAGGDGFDLETIGVERARFVRIRALLGDSAAPTAYFDLDAIGIVNAEVSP